MRISNRRKAQAREGFKLAFLIVMAIASGVLLAQIIIALDIH